MVLIKPFQALHPNSSNAKEIACFPYDVAYESEAREFVRTNPNSFLRVTRPEADFENTVAGDSSAVLEVAKRNLEELTASGRLMRDPEPSIYAYRLKDESHSQTGIVACCSLADYESGAIKKHERTQPDKVAERTAHMVAVRAQTGLILLAFKATDELDRILSETVEQQPIFEFVCANDITHTGWRISAPSAVINAFANIDSLYIADGHHRIESALKARTLLRSKNGNKVGREQFDFVMAGIFPADELQILPYNRAVKDLAGWTDEEFFEKIGDYFRIAQTGSSPPERHGEIHMYFRKQWYCLSFNVEYVQPPDPIERLDVTILQKYLLSPVLGIVDPSTDKRIRFVGGARGIEELERMVDSGEAAAAFALYRTTMDDLFAISDMGEIMPPKSTWFEPKLKDGLFVQLI